MRSAIVTATFALAILAAPVPKSSYGISMGEHVPESIHSAQPEPFTRTHDSYRKRHSEPDLSGRIHDGRSADPEPFTRNHGSYRTRSPEPQPFTRNHGSYRTRSPGPEPFPVAAPIYKSNGRSEEGSIATRSPTLTEPKNSGPQDTDIEVEESEMSMDVEARALRNDGQPHGPKHKGGRDLGDIDARALRNDGQPHGPKHKGGRSTDNTVEDRDNRNTERDAEPEPTTRGNKNGSTPGNRGGRGSKKRTV